MYDEDQAWLQTDIKHLWMLDKLLLSRHLNYVCGPVGLDVPKPGVYIVRPCVNIMGLGLEAHKTWIEKETDTLPIGHFWCEWFEGKHVSVDYDNFEPILTVQGHKEKGTLTKWSLWNKIDHIHPFPDSIRNILKKNGATSIPRYINIEFIGDKVIEIHFRRNPDFQWGNIKFIPIFEDDVPKGHRLISCPDKNGRVAAIID